MTYPLTLLLRISVNKYAFISLLTMDSKHANRLLGSVLAKTNIEGLHIERKLPVKSLPVSSQRLESSTLQVVDPQSVQLRAWQARQDMDGFRSTPITIGHDTFLPMNGAVGLFSGGVLRKKNYERATSALMDVPMRPKSSFTIPAIREYNTHDVASYSLTKPVPSVHQGPASSGHTTLYGL